MKLTPEKRLRRWLFNHDIPQRAFAESLAITPAHLSNILSGMDRPGKDLGDRICKMTGVRFPLDGGRRRPLAFAEEDQME